MDILIFLLLAGAMSGTGFLFSRHQKNKHRLAELEKQKELEGKKYEHLKEILADAVITGNPAAVEALKPIAEAIAKDITADKERAHLLAEIEARNEPYRLWNKQVEMLWKNASGVASFQCAIDKIENSTIKMFPDLQLPAADVKKLTQGNK